MTFSIPYKFEKEMKKSRSIFLAKMAKVSGLYSTRWSRIFITLRHCSILDFPVIKLNKKEQLTFLDYLFTNEFIINLDFDVLRKDFLSH